MPRSPCVTLNEDWRSGDETGLSITPAGRGSRNRGLFPVDRQPELPVVPVAVKDIAVPPPEEVHVAGDLDVAPAVLFDEIDPPFLPPFQRLKTVGRFADAEGRLGEIAE